MKGLVVRPFDTPRAKLRGGGIADIKAVRAVCEAVTVPVNLVVGLSAKTFAVDELSQAGVRRIDFVRLSYSLDITEILIVWPL
ncbi:hypothetical protein [uncultured Roseobacter sp.]|uniref:hypothetical protein n=1 Tax=uncultured Roseobacter sp. TaxID=114847 RepID=UPI002628259D|nr:hypothetical protein [uncultured Roseobacter sp.]